MNRIEREELLRRYLEGEMNLQQEHDFFIQVALDKELRHELKAQQTIEKAFRKDGSFDMAGYGSVQANVAAMLASLPSPASASTPEEPLHRSRPGGRGGWILAGAASVILTIGTFLALQLTDGSQASGLEEMRQRGDLESVETERRPATTPGDLRGSSQTGTSSELRIPMPEGQQQLSESSPLPESRDVSHRSAPPANGPTISVPPSRPADQARAETDPSGREQLRPHEQIGGAGFDQSRAIGNDTLQAIPPAGPLRSNDAKPSEPNDSIDVSAKLKWNSKMPSP